MAAAALYLDTNVFIDLVEGVAPLKDAVLPLFEALRTRPGRACTSELTLAEVLVPGGDGPLRQTYLDLLTRTGLVDLVPVSRDVLVSAAGLRAASSLRLPDAIHVATAAAAGCRGFLTRDRRITGLPHGIERIEPAPDRVAALAAELAAP
jgi:predicted nucleic acid-binding protein